MGPYRKSLLSRVSITAAALLVLILPTTSDAYDKEQLARLLENAGLSYGNKNWLKPAWDIDYKDVRTGKILSLRRDLAGKVVVINFWATWCPPCRREMPSLESLYQSLKTEGLVVLGVNIKEGIGDQRSRWFAGQWQLTFPMVAGDFNGPDGYITRGIPTTYIVDRNGLLIGARFGPHDWTHGPVMDLFRFLLASES